jgi:hypothetical protein
MKNSRRWPFDLFISSIGFGGDKQYSFKTSDVNNSALTLRHLLLIYSFLFYFASPLPGATADDNGRVLSRAAALCWGCSQVSLTVKFFLILSFGSLPCLSLFGRLHKMIRETLSKQERQSFISKSELYSPLSTLDLYLCFS